MKVKGKHNMNVPNLRFREFEGKWLETNLGSILKVGNGKDYRHLGKGDIPVFGTGGYMTSVNDYLYDGESVCIGRKGTINKPFYFNGKFWSVDTLFYTHSYKNVFPKFLFYVFEQINWLKYNEASGVPSLSKTTIESIEVSMPCPSEQKKIADFLSLLDSRIETQSQIVKELETLIKGLIHSFVRKKEGNIQLKECLNCHSSTLTESAVMEKNGIYPVYGATGIIAHIPNYEIGKDAILIIKDGSGVGKVQYVKDKYSVIGTLNYLTPKENVSLKYLYYYLQTFNFDKYKVGSGIPHIYFKDYGNEYIYCPPIEEQNKIANFLSAIDEKLEIEKQILKNYTEQKKFLLANMFI